MPGTASRRQRHLDALAATDAVAANALKRMLADEGLYRDWLEPVQQALQEAIAGLPDSEPTPEDIAAFKGRLGALLDAIPKLYRAMDTRSLEEALSEAMFAADANGRMAAAPGGTTDYGPRTTDHA